VRENKYVDMAGTHIAARESAENQSIFARLALPFMFNPNLGPAGALIAVVWCLARIFSSCLLMALWGGFSAWVWTAISSHFWRMAAVVPLLLLFPAALAGLLLAIGAVETRIKSRF
jgi:hypothetical protein